MRARAYVERTGRPWFILSAEHGVVPPNQILAPYERTLNSMGKRDRERWAARVRSQLDLALPETDHILVLAGSRYREFLMDYLRQRPRFVDAPLEHLGIGKQLHYLLESLSR